MGGGREFIITSGSRGSKNRASWGRRDSMPSETRTERGLVAEVAAIF